MDFKKLNNKTNVIKDCKYNDSSDDDLERDNVNEDINLQKNIISNNINIINEYNYDNKLNYIDTEN